MPHWVYDAGMGLTVALAVITVAQAALPEKPAPRPAPAEALAETPAAEPAPRTPTAFTFTDPAPGHAVVSPFGLRQLPWEEHGRLHAGVDIAAPAGTPVRAVAHGIITRTGEDAAYGRFIEVRHAAGVTSFYAHLGSVGVNMRKGAVVMLGAPIGAIGNSGSSTGAHLHLEIRDKRGRPLDPTRFLGQEFAGADELPLTAASRFTRRVRLAHVSTIPAAKRKLMEDRQAEKLAAAKSKQLAASLQSAKEAMSRQAPPVVIGQSAPLVPEVADGRTRVVIAVDG